MQAFRMKMIMLSQLLLWKQKLIYKFVFESPRRFALKYKTKDQPLINLYALIKSFYLNELSFDWQIVQVEKTKGIIFCLFTYFYIK